MANRKSKKKIGIYDSCVNSYIFDLVENDSVCLDVGCWTGNLGRQLIEKKNCQVDGVDFDAEVLKRAKANGYEQLYNINLNCEIGKLGQIRRKYDCIIYADVLEHLIDPLEVLKMLKSKLRKGGSIIISTPNIAFAKQRLELLLGRFDYNPNGGIMDATHLTFFTLKSLRETCRRAGLDVKFAAGYSLVKNKYFILRWLAKIWPTMFAIQLSLKAEAKKG